MAALYVHIPFCRSRCIYCGFYSTTLTQLAAKYVEAVCTELNMLAADPCYRRLLQSVRTVYIGGGTPSQLSPALLDRLFGAIAQVCGPLAPMEVTIECNPDDLTEAYAASLARLPVNRVSMGAQTFSDRRLRFLHRRHNARQVGQAVQRLRAAGISNISIDLMFGFPGETLPEWETDIREALALQVEHISAYSLMTEPGTPGAFPQHVSDAHRPAHRCRLRTLRDIQLRTPRPSVAPQQQLLGRHTLHRPRRCRPQLRRRHPLVERERRAPLHQPHHPWRAPRRGTRAAQPRHPLRRCRHDRPAPCAPAAASASRRWKNASAAP